MRKIASVIASAGLLVSLTACVSTPSTFANCGPSGNAALVSAEGGFGSDPGATFPTPLVATKAETAQVREGDGDQVPRGGVVQGALSLYLGETGEALSNQSGPLTGLELLIPTHSSVFVFAEALECARDGARVVTTGTAEQLFGADALGLDPKTSLVVVVDVEASFLGKANGADQIAESGLPAVVFAPSGQPGFTFPDSPAPTDLRVSLLKRGSGAVVAEGDSVVVHHTSIAWNASAVTATSWQPNGIPIVVTAGEAQATGELPTDVTSALVGLPVGSQVLVVVPGETATVYVVDVLGIQ